MSASPRVVELQMREPTPAQAAEELRARLYLDELREGPPFPLWRMLHVPSWREYAPADQLDCYRLEMELAQLRVRWWESESFAELLEIRRRMFAIDRGLEGRSIGVWLRDRGGLRLIEGRTP